MKKMQIIKPKWDIDEAEAIYWIVPEAYYSMTIGMRKIYGFGFNRNVVIFEKGKPFKWCLLTAEMESVGNKCLEKFKSKQFRQKIEKEFLDLKTKVDVAISDYQLIDQKKTSIDKLFEYLKLFNDYYRLNFSYGFFAEPFDYIFPDIFEKSFRQYGLDQSEINNLAMISKPSYLGLEMQGLIKLAVKKKKGMDIKNELAEHFKKYEWITTGHAGKKKIGLDFFTKRISQLTKDHKNLESELLNLKNFSGRIISVKNKIIKKYKFSKESLKFIEIINQVGPWHDLRKELFVKTIFYADSVREELAKRFGYSLFELQFLTLNELLPLKEGKKLNRVEIKRRSNFIFLDLDYFKKKLKVYSGSKYKKLVTKEFLGSIDKSEKIIGTIASGGKAIGLVKVIFGQSGFHKMKKGDVLVTGMTRPEMLPIMKKAAAIVTDEGGLTCHAAIVARELKIPCIVGTNSATKVLKDGDMVEVDATNGIVRKI